MRRFFVYILFVFTSVVLFSQELSIQTGHSSMINDLQFSSDNRYLFSCGADNKVIIWDMSSLKQMRLLVGHKSAVNAIAVSPTENIFATCDNDGMIFFRNYPEGKILKTIGLHKPIKDISLVMMVKH